jgi:hypothetical protein
MEDTLPLLQGSEILYNTNFENKKLVFKQYDDCAKYITV